MPKKISKDEQPLTLSLFRGELDLFRKELRDELTQRLAVFYTQMIEPEFRKIDGRFEEVHAHLDDHDGYFDDIYKKMETLQQEYVISNEQMRRLENKIAGLF